VKLTAAHVLAARKQMRVLDRPKPEWARKFDKPARYKAAYGGRASGKSHEFAERLIERCVRSKTRAVCIREVQNSLKESVRQLLVDKIQAFGMGDEFEVLEAEIRGPNGSLIIFRGMQAYNAETIKSLEGYDVAWVEEAQTLSATSLRMLRPTIRAPGSELWFTWNPRHDSDAVDNFFRGASPPSNSIIDRVNWDQNPWLPAEMVQEMEDDRKRDPESAVNVWDGGYEIVTEGSYYALLLAEAENEGRVGDFPYDPALPVLTSWDIGVDDYTAIWFLQERANVITAIDFYETSGDGAEEIVRLGLPELAPEAQREFGWARAGRPFRYGRHFFPHDVKVREWGAGRSRLMTLQELGLKSINVGLAVNPAERINAVRKVLPFMRFNKETTNVGIKHLRGYSRRFNRAMETYSGPLHDSHSHAADAMGEFAINCHLSQPKIVAPPVNPPDLSRWGRKRATGGGTSAWG
jgi:phage terminase large subunit